MFPDYEIAKSYTNKADKIKHMMQFEIVSVIRDVDFGPERKTIHVLLWWNYNLTIKQCGG